MVFDASSARARRRQGDALDRALKIAVAKARIFILSDRAEFMTPLSAPGGLAAHWRNLCGDELVDLEVEQLNARPVTESSRALAIPIPPGVWHTKPPPESSESKSLPVSGRAQRQRD